MSKLESCPFCGGEARGYYGNTDCYGVVCKKCGVKIYGYSSQGSATKAWNRRTYDCTDDFEKMRHVCGYGDDSYDENRVLHWVCHHEDNKPAGCSCGKCDRSVCPILKGE